MRYPIRYDRIRKKQEYLARRDEPYPLKDMKPTGSFAVPLIETSAVRSAIQTFEGKNPGWKFATVREGEELVIWCDKRP